METTNPYERAGRAEKVNRLLTVISAADIGTDMLDKLDDTGWQILADKAGVAMPSAETRRQVVEWVRGVEESMDRCSADDVFAKLGENGFDRLERERLARAVEADRAAAPDPFIGL